MRLALAAACCGALAAPAAAPCQVLTQRQAEQAFAALVRSPDVSALFRAFQTGFPRDFERIRVRFLETAIGPEGQSGAEADAIAAIGAFAGLNGSYLHTSPAADLKRVAERYRDALAILAGESAGDCVRTAERRGGKSFTQSEQAIAASFAIDAAIIAAIKTGRDMPVRRTGPAPDDMLQFNRAMERRGFTSDDSARLTSGTDRERCRIYHGMFAAIADLPPETSARLFIQLTDAGTYGPPP